MTLWSLWKSRNLLLWDDSDTPILTVTRAQDVLHDWSCVQKAKYPTHHDNQPPAWGKSPHSSIKCNVEASLLNGNSVMCYCLYFRDSSGNLLFGKSGFKLLTTTLLEVETMGLLEALTNWQFPKVRTMLLLKPTANFWLIYWETPILPLMKLVISFWNVRLSC